MKSHKTLCNKFSFICQNYNLNLKIKTLSQVGNSVVGKKISKVVNAFVENNLNFK